MVKNISEKFANSREEIEKILQNETLGFLGLCTNDKPYVIPLTYCYHNGLIIFHCALQGIKLDYIKANPQVCFTVGRQSGKVMNHPHGSSCKADHDSAVCFGIARIIEDINERCKALNTFNHCLQPYAKEILTKDVSNCLAVEISITRMTGRQQRKGTQYTYWEYNFR
jgi:nitroimidazol reductase NimA-like FMN-containing flavoprotein (pyridoxamine 5'-phosphate oxidase superfamily)